MDQILPIRVAANGRHFVDHRGQPFFWLGDTQWNLFRCHDFAEAKHILDNRRQKGFSVVQVMGLGFARQVQAGPLFGEAFPEKDLSKPNEAYFAHVDQIVEYAAQIGTILAIGLDHPAFRLTNLANARAYARWVSQRYQRFGALPWCGTTSRTRGSACPPPAKTDAVRSLASHGAACLCGCTSAARRQGSCSATSATPCSSDPAPTAPWSTR